MRTVVIRTVAILRVREATHNGDGHSANTQARNSSDVKSVDKQSRQSQSARTEHKDKETTVNEKPYRRPIRVITRVQTIKLKQTK